MDQRVLLTGASGFVAAHVLRELLEGGYFVRFTVRSQEKANQILGTNKSHEHRLEPIIVPGDAFQRRIAAVTQSQFQILRQTAPMMKH